MYFCKDYTSMKIFILVLRFFAAPVSSWEIIRGKRLTAQQHERTWFYPLLALAGVSAFAQMLYGDTLTMSLIRAIAVFTAFFLGNILCPILLSYLLPKWQDPSKRPVLDSEIKLFTTIHLSVPVLVSIVQNLLPTPLLPLYIFPIYLLFTISKCAESLNVTNEEKKLLFIFVAFAIIILVPVAILSILWQFIPQENNL